MNGIRAAKDAGAHVMQIDQVTDVNYANIVKYIQKVMKGTPNMLQQEFMEHPERLRLKPTTTG